MSELKYFLAYFPAIEEAPDGWGRVYWNVEKSTLVVVKNGRPYRLASFVSGYTSKDSATLYGCLSIYQEGNGKKISRVFVKSRCNTRRLLKAWALGKVFVRGNCTTDPDSYEEFSEVAEFFGFEKYAVFD